MSHPNGFFTYHDNQLQPERQGLAGVGNNGPASAPGSARATFYSPEGVCSGGQDHADDITRPVFAAAVRNGGTLQPAHGIVIDPDIDWVGIKDPAHDGQRAIGGSIINARKITAMVFDLETAAIAAFKGSGGIIAVVGNQGKGVVACRSFKVDVHMATFRDILRHINGICTALVFTVNIHFYGQRYSRIGIVKGYNGIGFRIACSIGGIFLTGNCHQHHGEQQEMDFLHN